MRIQSLWEGFLQGRKQSSSRALNEQLCFFAVSQQSSETPPARRRAAALAAPSAAQRSPLGVTCRRTGSLHTGGKEASTSVASALTPATEPTWPGTSGSTRGRSPSGARCVAAPSRRRQAWWSTSGGTLASGRLGAKCAGRGSRLQTSSSGTCESTRTGVHTSAGCAGSLLRRRATWWLMAASTKLCSLEATRLLCRSAVCLAPRDRLSRFRIAQRGVRRSKAGDRLVRREESLRRPVILAANGV